MNKPKYPLVTTLLLTALATFSGTSWSQGRMARDPLARLKYALQEAGATALTSAQETTLSALITAFQTAHQTPPAPSTALQDARAAYDAAILNQDSAGAAAQAAIIASEQAANGLQRQIDVANFGIDVIKVLKSSGDQVTPLATRFGTSGAVRLVLSLAGGPGFGRGGPDHGEPPVPQ